MKIYGDSRSGNCYKLQLLLAHLGRDCDWQEVDVLSGYTRSSEFLALNPNGKLPLLQLDDGRLLAESGACLVYLAEGTPFWPEDAFARAQTLQWMFFEQYSHEPYIATVRFWKAFLHGDPKHAHRYEWLVDGGYKALDVMEHHLREHEWFSAGTFGLADIALFAYTHVADEGGYDLAEYPAIQTWLQRVAAVPGHRTMQPLVAPRG